MIKKFQEYNKVNEEIELDGDFAEDKDTLTKIDEQITMLKGYIEMEKDLEDEVGRVFKNFVYRKTIRLEDLKN